MLKSKKHYEVEKFWVYTIYVPSIKKYYVGCSQQTSSEHRFTKSTYKTKTLGKYLNEWEKMSFNVIVDDLTKEEALLLEDKIIQFYKKNNLCINKNRSGQCTKNMREYKRNYNKQWRQNNETKTKQQC